MIQLRRVSRSALIAASVTLATASTLYAIIAVSGFITGGLELRLIDALVIGLGEFSAGVGLLMLGFRL